MSRLTTFSQLEKVKTKINERAKKKKSFDRQVDRQLPCHLFVPPIRCPSMNA
jgi:hypothetical protein